MPSHPPPGLLILSEATGRPLPITPSYARALRNSLRSMGLLPPEVKTRYSIIEKNIKRGKNREDHEHTERSYHPSPLCQEILPEDPHTKPTQISILLKQMLNMKESIYQKDPLPISLPIITPRHPPQSWPTRQIQLQPQIYYCKFARLNVPERGRLIKRLLALDRHQDAHVARQNLRQTTGVAIEFPAPRRESTGDAVHRCNSCLERERGNNEEARKGDRGNDRCGVAEERSEGKGGDHCGVEGGEGTGRYMLKLRSCSRRLNVFSKRVLTLRGRMVPFWFSQFQPNTSQMPVKGGNMLPPQVFRVATPDLTQR